MAKQTPNTEAKSAGIYLFMSDVDTASAAACIEWILGENMLPNAERAEHLTLMINSDGGDLSAAFALIEVMQGSPIPVRTIGLGTIASAGLIIFMSGTKGMRTLTPTCSVMSHSFSTSIDGTYHDLLSVQKELSFVQERTMQQYRRCTNLADKIIIDKLMPKNDVWLSPKEAVKLGLADEIKGLGGHKFL